MSELHIRCQETGAVFGWRNRPLLIDEKVAAPPKSRPVAVVALNPLRFVVTQPVLDVLFAFRSKNTRTCFGERQAAGAMPPTTKNGLKRV